MMRALRLLFTAALLAFLATPLTMAQNKTITGTVTDGDNGDVMPGVTVQALDETGESIEGAAVTTDFDGKYSVSVPDNAVSLQFTFFNYKTTVIEIGSQSSIDIALPLDQKLLETVVVTGYQVQKKRDVSGAVASVKAEAIDNMPVQGFDRAIQGRLAGVQVTGSSGIPGAAVQIRIRGTGSINSGNEPLYIVDGVQISSGDNSGLVQSTNPLTSINPNDIESVDVLKDAAAAAIYGAQAANGVIIITTKRGSRGKTKFSLNASVGITERLDVPEFLSGQQFAALHLEGVGNSFGLESSTYGQLLSDYNDLTAENITSADQILGAGDFPNYDWQDPAFEQGLIQNYELSARGGDERTSFFLSAGFNDVDAHVINTTFQRANFRLNFDHKLSDRMKIEASINLSNSSYEQPPGGGAFANPFTGGGLITPIQPIRDENGDWNFDPNTGRLPGLNLFNVYQVAETNYQEAQLNQIIASFAVNYEIIDGLTYRGLLGLDYQGIREELYWDPRHGDGFEADDDEIGFNLDESGFIQNNDSEQANWQTDHTLTYNKVFDQRHNLTALAGFQYRQQRFSTMSASGQGLISPALQTLNNTGDPQFSEAGGGETEWKLAGYFARVGYILDDKYIINVTGRYDGSSRFGDNNRFAFFPAASLAWQLGDEEFMSFASKYVSSLKLRASYGITGNQSIGNFSWQRQFGNGGTYNGSASLGPTQFPNPDLRWEENRTLNFGLDFSVLNNRLTAAVDYYIRDTHELILNEPVPLTTGFGAKTANAGVLRNEGIEIEARSINLDIKGFRWTTDFNITFQRTEVLELSSDSDTLIQSNFGGTYIVGQPARGVFLQEYAGVNVANGSPMYIDENGEITYTPASGPSRSLRGSLNPDYFGGITNTFSYGKENLGTVSLSVFFQFQQGNEIYNNQRFFLEDPSSVGNFNQSTYVLRRWQQPGDVTDVPQALSGTAYASGVGGIERNTNRFMEDGSYIRLKQVSLSYSLPTDLVRKAKLQGVQVYAQGVNLWTETEYTGYDPELASQNDFFSLPQARTWTFGVRVDF